MADEQDKWLNREMAERLLRGESAEAVDAFAADRAERLFELLGALSAQAAPATSELPGEQAALAAFRKARDAAADERAAAPGVRLGASARGHDAGLVRIGARTPARRPAWRRPVRLARAAGVAAGPLGGVAVAAGSGVLPTPFDEERPAPAASATSSGRPLAPATPQAPTGTAAPGGTPGTARADGSDRATGPDGRTGTGTHPGSGAPGGRWGGAVTACRDLRAGTGLGADRRRALDDLAGGSARVAQYCKLVLAAGEHTAVSPTPGRGGDNDGRGQGEGRGRGHGSEQGGGGDQNGNGQGGDDDSHPGTGKGNGLGEGGGQGSGPGQVRVRQSGGVTPAPAPSAHGPRRPRAAAGASSDSPSPSPS
ncbi:hypothetical protein [Streptomyces misionensis]|uniref:hypothetical protein n=1 Tax=Streptomyces misionensis TaxID=67331 RepID=UPI0036785449